MQKDTNVTQGDHRVAERVAFLCKDFKTFVVWWTYSANYAEPRIEMENTPVAAFNKAFPQYARVESPELHKYAVEIQNCGKANELREGKPVTIGSREYYQGYPDVPGWGK